MSWHWPNGWEGPGRIPPRRPMPSPKCARGFAGISDGAISHEEFQVLAAAFRQRCGVDPHRAAKSHSDVPQGLAAWFASADGAASRAAAGVVACATGRPVRSGRGATGAVGVFSGGMRIELRQGLDLRQQLRLSQGISFFFQKPLL